MSKEIFIRVKAYDEKPDEEADDKQLDTKIPDLEIE